MTENSGSGRKFLSHAAVPAVVTAVLLIAVIAGFLLLRTTVNNQEKRLLKERADEVKLVLGGAFSTLEAELNRLGAAARYGGTGARSAGAEAKAIERNPGSPGRTIALVRLDSDEFVVTAAAGPRVKVGDRLPATQLRAASAALRKPGLQSPGVVRTGERRTLPVAVGPPATPPGHVAVALSPINPNEVAPQDKDSPFNALNLALYASPQPRADQLLVKTTSNVPLEGDVVNRSIDVGDNKWLIQTSARDPLIGPFAMSAPWITLGIGLLAAIIAGSFLQLMQRRRDYALGLVDERTTELQESLLQLGNAQQSLVMQQRLAAVGQVAAAVGHELRNPLGVMTNALFLARTQLSPDNAEKVARHIDTTEREIAAATVIVESLLSFTRDKNPDKNPVDFDALFEEALTVTPPPVGVEVVRVGLETLPPIDVDRQQLRQVILNLLTNSYQAMEGKGVMTVAGRAKAHEIELTFADTGTGLDHDTATQIFEPFFTRKATGIGLGLAVTQQIIEAHGGSIKVKSKPGEGATFVVSLPNTIPVRETV